MLYTEAARILKLVESKQGSAKNLTLSSSYKNKRQLVAIVYETLKFSSVLQQILTASNLQSLETSLKDVHLTKILVYDAIFGNGIQGNGKPEKAVRKHSALLQTELDHLKAKLNVRSNTDLLSHRQNPLLPRYVRINTLKSSAADVVEHFRKDGYRHISLSDSNFEQFQHQVKSLKPDEFVCDIHVPELLVFAAGTDLHEHELCTNGSIILQDKASCFPAIVLNPPCGSHIIDCCAAPGNKTVLLAALMNNDGKIFAFDRDASRLSTMHALLKKAGAECVSVTHKDFVRVDPYDPKYKDVKYILVDPSCSGSGMVNRIEDEDKDSEAVSRRLTSLSNFQAMLLRHALNFPSVRRVVYSTCSVYERENEQVIQDVLQSKSSDFQLVDVLPMISSRGKSSGLLHAERCVRMSPETSLTVGFFIACLERVNKVPPHHSSSSKSEFAGRKEKSSTVSESPTHEMQIETGAVSERRKSKSHKSKKLKKEKTAKLERAEVDATLVKYGSDSEVDGQPQKSLNDELSCVSMPTAGSTESETTEKSRKSHKRKKSKHEKSAKLEHSEIETTVGLERLDHLRNSTDLLPTSDAMQTEQITAGNSEKSHKRKKRKKEKAARVEQSEIPATVVDERSEFKSELMCVSESTSAILQTEHSRTAGESRKSHKHKKSKKEKSEKFVVPEHSAIDSIMAADRLKFKKPRKHKKCSAE